MNLFAANPDMKIAFSSFFLAALGLSAAVGFGAGPVVDPNYFRPFQGEQIALAPDGRHLAYTSRQGLFLSIIVLDLDRPEARRTLPVAEDTVAVRGPQRRDAVIAGLRFFRWLDSTTLVYQVHAFARGRLRDEVWRVDAEGKNDRKVVDADGLGLSVAPPPAPPVPRPLRVLGFDLSAPDLILVEVLGLESAATESFAVQVSTGKGSSVAKEEAHERYLYDHQGQPRVRETRPLSMSVNVTRHYEVKTPAGWEPLDQLLGSASEPDFEVSPARYYGPRSFPIGFGADENLLYIASNQGRDTYGIYALDLHRLRRTDFALEDPAFDLAAPDDAMDNALLVSDRKEKVVGVRLRGSRPMTRWFEPELTRVQSLLDERFTARTAKIVEWDETRRRFLVSVSTRNDPGRCYIFEPGPPVHLTEVIRAAPKLDSDAFSPVTEFAFVTPAGVSLNGVITLPRRARVSPPPLVVYLRDLPGLGDRGEFDRESAALASMGFAVARLNGRGSFGRGLKQLESVKASFDRIPLEDTRAAILWLGEHFSLNRNRVALIGEGFGAYVATRALELYPDDFRAAVALDLPSLPPPPSAIRLGSERARAFFGNDLSTNTLIRDVALMKRPLLLLASNDRLVPSSSPTDALRLALKGRGVVPEYLDLNDDLIVADTDGKAKVFSRIVTFLNQHVYDTAADLNPLKE